MNSRRKKLKKGEPILLDNNIIIQIRRPKGLHFVQNVPYYITGENKGFITLNNKAYMLTANCGESRRLKRVPLGTSDFLPTL